MVIIAPPSPPTSRPPKIGFRSDIQGLRALAVLLVVVYHAGATTISGGYIGVDVFFVISGFLITTHLLESLEQHGRIHLGQFYAKRARRILPAAFTVLVGTVVAAMIWMPPLMLESVFEGAIATAVYLPNIYFARQGTDYLAETAPSVFQHYWSLGIEEQFYLVWPVALLLIYRLLNSERSMFRAVLGLVLASFVLCVILTPINQPWAFFSLPTRAWELGIGALVAFVLRAHAAQLATRHIGLLAWAGLVALLLVAVTYDSTTPFPGYLAAAPAIATALIIAGGVGRSGPSRLLSARPLQFIGLISYSLYLVHWPLLVIPQAAAGLNNPLPLWMTLGLGGLSVPSAYLLYRFVEDPARKVGPLIRAKPRTTLVLVVITTAVITSASLASMAYTQRQPLYAGPPAAQADVRLFPEGTDYVPSNLQPALRDAAAERTVVSKSGCHRDLESADASGCLLGANPEAPVVALFGDSHAAAWSSALLQMAEDGEIQLDVNTKSACRSADVPVIRNNVLYTSCETWRDAVIERLSREKPDVVLLTNYGAELVDAEGAMTMDTWAQGLASTIDAMPSDTTVGVIADTPFMGESPAICLSANLADADNCSRPRDIAIPSDLISVERQVAQSASATYLDFTDYLCGTKSCPAIIGNRLVYSDGNHITPAMGSALSQPMEEQVRRLLD